MLRKTLLKRVQRKILDLMAKVKSDIQDIQLWVDDSPKVEFTGPGMLK